MTPNDAHQNINNLVNSLSKENDLNTTTNNLKNIKPLKGRKAISNKDLIDTVNSSVGGKLSERSNLQIKNLSINNQISQISQINSNSNEESDSSSNSPKNDDNGYIVSLVGTQNINKNIQVFGSRSRAGNQVDGSRKTNQDSSLIMNNILGNKDFSAFGVYDGHGKNKFKLGVNGHKVSQHFVKFLKEYFSNPETYNNTELINDNNLIYSKLIENNYDIIKKAYLKGEVSLFTQSFDSAFSGSTAVSTFIIGDKILCANAGDSRTIVVESNKNLIGNF